LVEPGGSRRNELLHVPHLVGIPDDIDRETAAVLPSQVRELLLPLIQDQPDARFVRLWVDRHAFLGRNSRNRKRDPRNDKTENLPHFSPSAGFRIPMTRTGWLHKPAATFPGDKWCREGSYKHLSIAIAGPARPAAVAT
jgi:hypothetical protein